MFGDWRRANLAPGQPAASRLGDPTLMMRQLQMLKLREDDTLDDTKVGVKKRGKGRDLCVSREPARMQCILYMTADV